MDKISLVDSAMMGSSIITAIATCIYAASFFYLQKQLNIFQKESLKRNRLIELSNEWHSREMIRSRMLVYQRLRECRLDRAKIPHIKEDIWVEISYVAHFMEKLGMLIRSDQIDVVKAREEYGNYISFWEPLIALAYSTQEEEVRLLKLIAEAKAKLST